MSFFYRLWWYNHKLISKNEHYTLYERNLTWYGRWRLRRLGKKLDRGIKKAVMEGRLKL